MTKHFQQTGLGGLAPRALETKEDGGNQSGGGENEIKQMIEAFGGDVKALKDSMAKDLSDVRNMAEGAKTASAEMDAKFIGIADEIKLKSEAIEALSAESKERMDKLETALARAPRGGTKDEADQIKHAIEFETIKLAEIGGLKYRSRPTDETVDMEGFQLWEKHFGTMLRTDERNMNTDEEVKALAAGSNPNGGYLMAPSMSSRVIERIYESSPVRQVATIETIGTDTLELGIDVGEGDAGWIGEETTPGESTTAEIGVQRIPVHEMYAQPKVTQKFLEDASIDVEAWLANKTGEKMARVEASAFVNGNGRNKPRGFLTYDAGTAGSPTRGQILQVNSGHASQVTSDGIVSLPFNLKGEYMSRGGFMMKRLTVLAVMLLKDNDGRYMWRAPVDGSGLHAKAPMLLNGFPLRQADDMPSVGANALAIAFADWRSAYTVVDRLGITTLRDNLTAKPFVKLYSRKRVGGDVTDFEAIVLQKIAA